MTRLCKILFSVLLPFTALAQVQLQPWTQIFGTVNGQQLGKYVTGITPSANFPYKAAVSQIGSTGIYRLQTASDTVTQGVFLGEDLLTGDLNNDGYKDVVVTYRFQGRDTVIVFWGTATGIDTLAPMRIPNEAANDNFRAACIADVNNDGYVDLVIVALDYGPSRGKVYLHFGPTISVTANAVILGDTILYRLGGSATVGNLNDDGYNDLVVRGWMNLGLGSGWYDYVRIYWGVGQDTVDLTFDVELRGYPLTSSGLACFDLNGDGVDDLLWTNRDSLDWVYVHYGSTLFSSTPNLRLRDPQLAQFGTQIINAGDMNGDGFKDIAVAAPYSIVNGFVIVFGGGPQIDQYFDAVVGMSSNSEFGTSISRVDDVNGDGLSDIVVGAPNYAFGNQRGYWGIFLGDSTMHVTDVEETAFIPKTIELRQCYPNPFNPVTTIPFDLGTRGYAVLKVYDAVGREVASLVDGAREAGRYEARFDARNLSSGVYYYRLTAETTSGRFTQTKSMTLLK